MTISGKTSVYSFVQRNLFLFLGILFIVGCNHTDPYVFIPDRDTGLAEGSPVQIEDVVVGEVKNIDRSDRFSGNQVLHISLDREYSIPSNSQVRITHAGKGEERVLQIVVVASKSYLRPGDTVFFSWPELRATEPVDTVQDPAPDFFYRIQVLASTESRSLDAPFFQGLSDIEESFDGKLYKYYTGRIPTLDKAQELQRAMIKKGFEDAFIVAFVKGERISLDQAKQYEK